MTARRSPLAGFACLMLAAAAVVAAPRLAQALPQGMEAVTLPEDAAGGGSQAALALPQGGEDLPAVVLLYGQTASEQQVAEVAQELVRQDFAALAVPAPSGEAVSEEVVQAWVEWLRQRQETAGRVGLMGWGEGGALALRSSLGAPVQAVVVYYADVALDAGRLADLNAPVLGHFATRDDVIDEPMVSTFQDGMVRAGRSLELFWYDADSGFADPAGDGHDAGAAAQAWTRTLGFLVEHLRTARAQGRTDPTEAPTQTETRADPSQ